MVPTAYYFLGGIIMVDKQEIMIDGKLMEVAPIDKYIKNPNAYLGGYTAIDAGLPYIYPVISINSTKPGVVIRKNAPFVYVRKPQEEEAEQYKRDNMIDYSKARNYREFLEAQNMVRELEKDILTSPDSIYTPPEDPEDSAAMTAMKQAVTEKHIDLDKYEPRFGANYNNDKRTFNKNTISLAKIIRICNALDIKATLTLEDQMDEDGNMPPNPIGRAISVELTSGDAIEGEDE